MNTKIALALVTALSATALMPAATIAAPARTQLDREDFNAELVIANLRDRGVVATSVEPWNGYIRAYVTTDGVQTMQFFDATTYQPVNL